MLFKGTGDERLSFKLLVSDFDVSGPDQLGDVFISSATSCCAERSSLPDIGIHQLLELELRDLILNSNSLHQPPDQVMKNKASYMTTS